MSAFMVDKVHVDLLVKVAIEGPRGVPVSPDHAWHRPSWPAVRWSELEYQSCEHPGWRESEAARFCDALRSHLIARLPGMDEAPWEWTAEKVAQARAAQR